MNYLNNDNYLKIKKYFICFIMYSMLGWCYEVILETFIYQWGFSNRGVLFGPYCPVYGFGALTFILCFSRLMKSKGKLWFNIFKILIIFLGCMAVATFIELLASYILELATGAWPWQTYADYKYNFQARIALSTSIRFGIGGVIFLYIVQPFFELILSKISKKTINLVFYMLLIVLTLDCIYTFILK